MAKKDRKVLHDFGGAEDNVRFFQRFGGFTNQPPNIEKTKDIDELQKLDAFSKGWQAACEDGNKLPVMEEMNSLFYLFGYFIKYLYQEGIPEWNVEETYYKGSIVKYDGYLYKAIYENPSDKNEGFAKQVPGEATDYWVEQSFKNLMAENITASNEIKAGSKVWFNDFETGGGNSTNLTLEGVGTGGRGGGVYASWDYVIKSANAFASGDVNATNITASNEVKTKNLVTEDLESSNFGSDIGFQVRTTGTATKLSLRETTRGESSVTFSNASGKFAFSITSNGVRDTSNMNFTWHDVNRVTRANKPQNRVSLTIGDILLIADTGNVHVRGTISSIYTDNNIFYFSSNAGSKAGEVRSISTLDVGNVNLTLCIVTKVGA